jgi:hypothetical protein
MGVPVLETTSKRVTQQIPVAWVCDSCGKREESQEESQEWLSWRHTGGYASVFGDGEELSLDLCQDCVQKLLGSAIQKHGNVYEPLIGPSIEILELVAPWAGSRLRALAWYRDQAIPSFGDRTAEELVNEGRADDVRAYLSRIGAGGFA